MNGANYSAGVILWQCENFSIGKHCNLISSAINFGWTKICIRSSKERLLDEHVNSANNSFINSLLPRRIIVVTLCIEWQALFFFLILKRIRNLFEILHITCFRFV